MSATQTGPLYSPEERLWEIIAEHRSTHLEGLPLLPTFQFLVFVPLVDFRLGHEFHGTSTSPVCISENLIAYYLWETIPEAHTIVQRDESLYNRNSGIF